MKTPRLPFRGPSRFDDPPVFVRSLGEGEAAAIEFLFKRTIGAVDRMAREAGLPRQEAEEALNDMAVVFIQKIREGRYELTGAPPHTYALGIARWLVRNRADLARNRRHTAELDPISGGANGLPGEPFENPFSQKEDSELVHRLLEKLPEKCRLLIRLRYFEGVPDEEAIAQGLTPYSTADSLKNRRKECLAKLRELARRLAPDHFLG